MHSDDDIDVLVTAFAALPGARAGRGPRHPHEPEQTLAPALSAYFAQFPALENDPDYVEFMWRYAALSRSDSDDTQLFDVFGFGDVAAELDETTDGPAIDDNGFFIFAQSVVHVPEDADTWEYDFAFSLAGGRPPGVYRYATATGGHSGMFEPFQPNFRAFLRSAVDTGGVWPRPELP